MSMEENLDLKCTPPFVVNFDYQVKDWLTNGLNVRETEAAENHVNYVKIPVREDVPLSVHVASISEKPMTIKNITLDVSKSVLLNGGVHNIEIVSQEPFLQIEDIEQDDSVCTNFVIKALD